MVFIVADGKADRYVYDIPHEQSRIVSGSCGDGTSDQNITIEWTANNLTSTMDLIFKFYENHIYTLYGITFDLNVAMFPRGLKHNQVYMYIGDDFWAPDTWSYHCTKKQTVELSCENRRYIMGTLTLTNIQFEATLTGNIEHFSKPYECRVDDIESSMCSNKNLICE